MLKTTLIDPAIFLLLLSGILGGIVAGMGGPGGLPVIISLNILVVTSPSVIAATTSSIFVVATITATGLYWYSDGIAWVLAGLIGVPAIIGTHIGTRFSPYLPIDIFETILGLVLFLAVLGIIYKQRKNPEKISEEDTRDIQVQTVFIVIGGFGIGIIAGITGIGGPALSVPLLLIINISPITAIGAGLASGILITISTTIGHTLQGNAPALVPFIVIGVPYVCSQFLGWHYVHVVSQQTIAYSIAALSTLAAIMFIL